MINNKLIKLSRYIPKIKIINSIESLEPQQLKRLATLTKSELINTILDNSLLDENKIIELYDKYKFSNNNVLYIFESQGSIDDSSYFNEEKIVSIIERTNKVNSSDSIKEFALDDVEHLDNIMKIRIAYNKANDFIFGGEPLINGYEKGDLIRVFEQRMATVYYFLGQGKMIVKCNDWNAIKKVVDIVAMLTEFIYYAPEFTDEFINLITSDDEGESHLVKASFFGTINNNERPKSISLSDEELDKYSEYNDINTDMNFVKTLNCFKVQIDGKARFVSISNKRGKMYIPGFIEVSQMNEYAIQIISIYNHIINENKDNIELKNQIHSKYKFYDQKNKDALLHSFINKVIVEKCLSERLLKDILKYGQNMFYITTPFYYDENNGIYQEYICDICKEPLSIKQSDGELFFKCSNNKCSYEQKIDVYLTNWEKEQGLEVEVTFSELVCIYPTKQVMQYIIDYIRKLSVPSFNYGYIYFFQGKAQIIKPNDTTYRLLTIDDFQILTRSLNNEITKTLKITSIKERCLRCNPKVEFCKECYSDKSVVFENMSKNEDVVQSHLLTEHKTRICLPRILGGLLNVMFDGCHTGGEKADVKFNYSDGKYTKYDANNKGTVGIHLKPAKKTDIKVNSAPLKSAIGQIITSVHLNHFEIHGFGIPNKLSDTVWEELEFIANKIGFKLLVIDQDAWKRLYSEFCIQLDFDKHASD